MSDGKRGRGNRGASRPPEGFDPRERACRELARLLASPDGLRTMRLTGLLSQAETAKQDAAPPPPPPDAEVPRPISIWQPQVRDGETVFVRPPVGPLGDHHADTPVLTRRRGTLPRRIAWFGESAAAGYLYAPHTTPAKVLEAQLAGIAGEGRYEVLDLARTNETLGPLLATVESALQLEPDLLVVYTGNNWPLLETPDVSPYVPSVRDRQAVAASFRPGQRDLDGAGSLDAADDRDGDEDLDGIGGVSGAVGLARKRLAGKATRALDRLAEIARDAEIPLLLVIPEVNLDDWESVQPPIWLPGDGTCRWHALFDQAREALAAEAWDEVERLAWEMNQLDGSSCPTPFRLLARAWRAQGKLQQALDAARAEVDCVHTPLLCCLGAPQATTAVRTLLADAARRHDLPTVDLREVFAEHTGSPLPGRRMFLDYCHLTSEGMHVLGATVAQQVLRLCPLEPAHPAEPAARQKARSDADRAPSAAIPPEAEATARLGAALHTAHRLLPLDPLGTDGAADELLEHWCSAALDASPEVAGAMVDLVALRLALLDETPAVLTEAFRSLQASPYAMTLQHGLRWGNLDLPVLRAIARALARAGRPEAATVDALLAEAPSRLAAQDADIELDLAADERFLEAPLARPYPEAMDLRDLTGRAALRAVWPETTFILPSNGEHDLTLELTVRLPPIPGVDPDRPLATDRAGQAEIRLQTTPADASRAAMPETLAQPHLTTRWTRAAVQISADQLPPGLHRLTIRWPTLPADPAIGTQAIEAARQRLEIGLDADLHPIFGEIASLVLKAP